ncbi:hypothetical protein WOLCODRAFT_136101 [Wolfiporia cocos MD-104 SS10]|uniref:Uncharacterized protein n=1 Tax=Wolfiporia cocos (strain MD-104) TaxID=742152 RepID=A0A2H3J7J1_WOLCO|nr:hypothetical protein WOLCODRAFT_136101 [Wolfiporia cocos MD-104 SS10]
MDSALPDYLWAWLNGRHRLTLCFTILTSWPSVNTRCIHYPVREPRTDEDNQTLCPILDFANHSENNSQIVPIINARSSVPKAGARQRSDDYRFVSCADSSIAKGQQLFLRYGGHANRTLFVEYGFVNHFEANAIIHGGFRGELDLQDSVEELLGKSLHDLHYPFIRRALEDEGYWGYHTLLFTHSRKPLMNASAGSGHLTQALHPRIRRIASLLRCVSSIWQKTRRPEALRSVLYSRGEMY